MGKQASAQVGPYDTMTERWRPRGEQRAALTAFILRRVLQSIVIMLIVTMITFGLLRMIPGNVAVAVMGTNAYRDPGAIKVFNADYGFNLPWYRQYFLWLGTLTTVALFSRYMRSSVLDNLTEDYVRTARAKGASELRVLARHVLRNSMITIATLLGLYLPAILGGALITEAVFNYPGMGYLFYQAAERQDYPILLGLTVVGSVATVIGNLLADIAYAALDPRVRYVSA